MTVGTRGLSCCGWGSDGRLGSGGLLAWPAPVASLPCTYPWLNLPSPSFAAPLVQSCWPAGMPTAFLWEPAPGKAQLLGPSCWATSGLGATALLREPEAPSLPAGWLLAPPPPCHCSGHVGSSHSSAEYRVQVWVAPHFSLPWLLRPSPSCSRAEPGRHCIIGLVL